MIEKLHDHITDELQQCSRTDTIFIITAILFNLIVLAINSAVADNSTSKNPNASDDIVLGIFMFLVIIINVIAGSALLTGKNTRAKLLKGLFEMYEDNKVDRYYSATHYLHRYFVPGFNSNCGSFGR